MLANFINKALLGDARNSTAQYVPSLSRRFLKAFQPLSQTGEIMLIFLLFEFQKMSLPYKNVEV